MFLSLQRNWFSFYSEMQKGIPLKTGAVPATVSSFVYYLFDYSFFKQISKNEKCKTNHCWLTKQREGAREQARRPAKCNRIDNIASGKK